MPNRALPCNKGSAMEHISQIQLPSIAHSVGDSPRPRVVSLKAQQKLALAVAMAATMASLGIAMYSGWQSGSLLIERIMRMVLIGIAVLVVHWLPLGWSAFRGISQFCAFALWIVATAVVLFGQATFFMTSQRHAGDLRAAAIPAAVVPTKADIPLGRSRTEIAREAEKVSVELARAQTQPCVRDCPMLRVRRVRLAAEISALGVEAEEAKRREASEDWRNAQAIRDDDRREALRADPVAFPVASWLGTTQGRLELVIGFASAVVLEGAAILAWTFVAVALGRDAGRSVTVPAHAHGAPEPNPVAEVESGLAVMSEEDQLLDRIRTAIVAGELKPTQNSIRHFLRCGQPKAGKLNRLYLEKFGSMQGIASRFRQNAVSNRLASVEVK